MSLSLRTSLLYLVLIGATLGYVDFRYHDYEQMTNILRYINGQYPNLTHIYSIGKSVMGRELWAVAIGYPGTASHHRLLVPEVKFVANIHGNEPVGREMLIHLLDYLTTQYSINPSIQRLLRNTRIHLMPSMNPDGFERATVGDCSGMRGRANANGYDLNRNFPDHFDDNSNIRRQPETTAIMNWLKNVPFLLSANMHGGALVANYPYDNYYGGSPDYKDSKESRSPDNDVFKYLALKYSRKNEKMYAGRPCPGDYAEAFQNGVSNGAAWYPLTGGMQDYNYIKHGCFEITLEMSCCKYPLPRSLTTFWALNRDAMIEYLRAASAGIRGFVRDRDNNPIKGASVKVDGRIHDYKTTKDGEYWRLLLPGTYLIEVEADGYHSADRFITIHLLAFRRLNFKLLPLGQL
ncbi:carboxypeptidase D-like isoform X2 [Lineus longissimus]|uniref:carboxypeptidase D-like isoform X2 n=1 Tax=Lineus longissimus TaxID=88925 RepID=UPI002B4C475B